MYADVDVWEDADVWQGTHRMYDPCGYAISTGIDMYISGSYL